MFREQFENMNSFKPFARIAGSSNIIGTIGRKLVFQTVS